jgi:predicted dehydrogenase
LPNTGSKTRERPLALGLAGCGRLAEVGYLPAIAATASIELVGVADPCAARREHLAAAAGAASFGSLAELVASCDVDAVVVAASTGAHVSEAETAARAGLPCLLEKPPAADSAGAERIAALDPSPWIGFNRRFHQALELGPAIPLRGRLAVELELSYRRASWRPHIEHGDALGDVGPHLVDLALLICGRQEPEVAAASVSERRAEIELVLSRGSATIRCATDRPHRERVLVRRPDGSHVAASASGGPLAALRGLARRGDHPLVASLRRQLDAFSRAARGGDPGLLATAADGVAVMRVIDAARRLADRADRDARVAQAA